MKLIDAEALKAEILKSPVWTGLDAIAKINTMPSIDIVRCKDCRHYAEHNELYINAPTNCVKHSTINHYVVVNADDFCSYGERKSDE